MTWALLSWRLAIADIALHPEQEYQVMSGWEATADLSESPSAPVDAAATDRLLRAVVDHAGINRVRLEIRAGAETHSDRSARFIAGQTAYDAWKGTRYDAENDNADPQVIDPAGFDFAELDWHVRRTVLPMASRLKARGEKLWINVCYVAFRDGRYFQMEPEEYAEFVLAAYLHLRDRFNVVPDSWEVILEPDNSRDAWTGKDIGRAIVAAAIRLRENGFAPAFIAPSVVDIGNATTYMDEIAAVPGAVKDVTELSYHRYRGDARAELPGIAAKAQSLGLRTSMLEWWFGHGTYAVLLEDIAVGNVSSWQGRVVQGLVDEPGKPADPYSLKEDVRFNSQIFRHVRMGARRIGASTTAAGRFDPLAFTSPGGQYVVVVAVARKGAITIHGLKPGRYESSFTTATEVRTLPISTVTAGGTLTVSMPAKGLLTVAGVRSPLAMHSRPSH